MTKPTTSHGPKRRSPKNNKSGRRPPMQREVNAGGAGSKSARSASAKSKSARSDAGSVAAGRTIRKTPSQRLPLYSEAPARTGPPTCTACGLCCTYVAIETDAPNTAKRATQLLWYVYHEGVSLYVNEDEWMVQFETTCKHLQADYRCGVYATRPHICREFSEQNCEINTGDDGHTFYTAAEFMTYLQGTRPRVHRVLEKNFAPPVEAARSPTSFEQRFQAVHVRRAALGV
jgi:Fe-S-cluster containining protein